MKRIEGQRHARFLTFSCYRRMSLLGTPTLRDEFADALDRARTHHRFALFAWVAMPNHVHLFVMPRDTEQTVATILRAIKQSHSQRVIRRWRALDAPILAEIMDAKGVARFWQVGGGYDRNIFSESEFREKIDYIHYNPVRAGLVMTPTAWAWSSAQWWATRDEKAIPMDPLPL